MSEASEIKKMNARGHKNSGRGQYQKGDASWNDFVVDIKEAGKTFRLTEDVWRKIVMDALVTDRNKHPMLMVALNGNTRLAIVEYEVLEGMLNDSGTE